jgi:hypothetical protein
VRKATRERFPNKKNDSEPIHGSPQQWLKHLRK